MKTTYLAADTQNGVFKIDSVEFPEMGITSPLSFKSQLSTLDDDEKIFAVFDDESEELYNEIDKEYGIH
jgi:hypothetical protein